MSELNRYGNKVGYHTPHTSAILKRLIEQLTEIEFEDSAWHNETCDSLCNAKLDLHIFLPNSLQEEVTNADEWNTFNVSILTKYGCGEDILNTSSIKELTEFIVARASKLKED